MINLEPCTACGEWILTDGREEADPAGVDAQTGVAALLAGRTLRHVVWPHTPSAAFTFATNHTLAALNDPTPPLVVTRHTCRPQTVATSARLKPSQPVEAPSEPPTPPVAPAARSTRSQGPSSNSSTAGSARSAETRGSDPRCAECSEPMADGTYAMIELGDLVVWSAHAEACTG